MRLAVIARAGAWLALGALAGCGDSQSVGTGAPRPTRKPGLWEEVVTRDGRPGRLGVMKLCLDASAGARYSVFGQRFDKSDCQRSISQDADRIYHFASTCSLGAGGVARTLATATGDFKTGYDLKARIDVSGAPFSPMNGVHDVHVAGRYLGPCPGDLRPGEASLGSGLKVNIDRLPQNARTLFGR